LGRKPGEEVDLTVQRGGQSFAVRMALASAAVRATTLQTPADDEAWDVFGLRLTPIAAPQFRQLSTYYRGGLSITEVRPGSPAYREGIRQGDVLVGIHNWQTVSLDNVSYVLKRPDLDNMNPVKFWILRGDKTFYGLLTVASHTAPGGK
jgi:serine protease Do